jgi:hypothetical protein
MPMTEAEWLACTDAETMLEFLRGKVSDRKLRLLASAFVRLKWLLPTDAVSLRAVEVAERFADGSGTKEEMFAARRSVRDAYVLRRRPENPQERPEAGEAARLYALNAANLVTIPVAAIAATHAIRFDARVGQQTLLRDIFGNPFHPSPPLPPSVLAWNDGTVRRLAQAIYEQRQLPAGTLDKARLAILADALLDAGCDDEALIQHCRSQGPHVRGCWAVDMILGKE